MFITVFTVILIIAAIFFINIKIKIHFCLALSEFRIELTVAGIKIKIKNKEESTEKNKFVRDIVLFITEHIKVVYFKLNVLLGLDDAFADVIAVQLVRNTFAAVYCLFKNAFTKRTRLFVNIMPAFNQAVLNLDFDCIISVRAGYIITAYIRHYYNIIKNKIRRLFT